MAILEDINRHLAHCKKIDPRHESEKVQAVAHTLRHVRKFVRAQFK